MGQKDALWAQDPMNDGLMELRKHISAIQDRIRHTPNQIDSQWLNDELARLKLEVVSLLRMFSWGGNPSYDMGFVVRLQVMWLAVSLPEQINGIALDAETKPARIIRGVVAILKLRGPTDLTTMARYLTAIGVMGGEKNPVNSLNQVLVQAKVFEPDSQGQWQLCRQRGPHSAIVRQLKQQLEA